ncbi:MAG: hypothetical protein JWQ87_1806 [Candidatus Sulfotelmatobacter sp.]|nr:hypothetical protein [Candidatus Sulfotelmatobacter sp.]
MCVDTSKLLCYGYQVMMTVTTQAEHALIRTIAGASRRLDRDLTLSPLQAIDRLQKFNVKFQKYWLAAPWLVLEDSYVLPAPMPVAAMLEKIGKHGQPIGIVGVAQVTKQQDSVLVMHFRKDDRNRKRVEDSAQAAKAILDKANEEAARLAKEIFEKKIQSIHGGKVAD